MRKEEVAHKNFTHTLTHWMCARARKSCPVAFTVTPNTKLWVSDRRVCVCISHWQTLDSLIQQCGAADGPFHFAALCAAARPRLLSKQSIIKSIEWIEKTFTAHVRGRNWTFCSAVCGNEKSLAAWNKQMQHTYIIYCYFAFLYGMPVLCMRRRHAFVS
jgi:hypothetical protein